jgi:hypothetical protein
MMRARGLAGMALLAMGVQGSCGCSSSTIEQILDNPMDGAIVRVVERREDARFSCSGVDEILRAGTLAVRWTYPVRSWRHFDVARYKQIVTTIRYPPWVVVPFIAAEALALLLLWPFWIWGDVWSIMLTGNPMLLDWWAPKETKQLEEFRIVEDITLEAPREDWPLSGATCTVEALAEIPTGRRNLKSWTGQTDGTGSWCADLRDLVPLLAPEDDAFLISIKSEAAGIRKDSTHLYLTARQIRELCPK